MPATVDYAERVTSLEAAIAILKDPDATPEQKNKLLKVIVDRIEYTGKASLHTNRKGKPKGDNSFTLEVFLRL